EPLLGRSICDEHRGEERDLLRCSPGSTQRWRPASTNDPATFPAGPVLYLSKCTYLGRAFMRRTISIAALLFLLAASCLHAQVSPAFNIFISPSIVNVTQGSTTSITVNIQVNEKPQFQFGLSGLPSGVVAQVPMGRPGNNTIVLTALSGASTGTFNV